jgi:uncharacterized RDD family membrane protein YckC
MSNATKTPAVEHLPASTLRRRLGAIAYDTLLLCAVWWCIGLIAVGIAGGEEIRPPHNRWLTLALAVAAYLYFAVQWSHGGQTLGMKSWRLVLEADDGRPPGWGRASARFLAAALSWLPLGAGFLWSLLDRGRLAWHDRLTGTRLRVLPRPGARHSTS